MNSNNLAESRKKSSAERLWGLFYVLSFILFAGLMHFEFIQDIRPQEAIDFYRIKSTTPASLNIAFAFNGLRAPPHIKDSRGWGIDRWRYFRGMSDDEYLEKLGPTTNANQPSEKADRHPFSVWLEIESPAEGYNYYCWEPGVRRQNSKCISRQQLDVILKANELVLSRYQQALEYLQADFVLGPTLFSNSVITISQQYRIRFWLQRDNLSAEDLARIALLLSRWKTIVDHSYLNSLDYSLAMVNYGRALGLFNEIAKLYPELLDIYQQNHGEFTVTPVDESLFNRLAIGDFYVVDNEICLSKSFGYNNSYCTPQSSSLFYKPGRTIKLLYENRHLISNCKKPDDPRYEWRSRDDMAAHIQALLRPGNYRGRLYANDRFMGLESICQSTASNRFRNEVFGLYQLHLKFKARNYSPAQITAESKVNPESFRIPHSDRYYQWDSASGSLILRHPNPKATEMYDLPYASQQ